MERSVGKIRHNWSCRVVAILLVLLSISLIVSTSEGQSLTYSTKDDVFAIPQRRAEISFLGNGSYSNAILEDDVWVFRNFRLNSNSAIPIFRVWADDCNVSVLMCRRYNSNTTLASIRYVVSGNGKQYFDVGPLIETSQWYVTFNGKYVAENQGYSVSSESTITVKGSSANVSMTCFNFSGINSANANRAFYEQHSVGIITLIVFSVGVVLLISIRKRVRGR